MSRLAEADARRFEFGKNWSRFAAELPVERVAVARESLVEMLDSDSLAGRSFLDIGSGSGIFSLGAASLGAGPVHSLDFDPDSVATTARLRERLGDEVEWRVERASVLDDAHMESLGEWDVVYSWGVLHHTGALWHALANTCARVAPGGLLFISIYNDQGWRSRLWTRIKRLSTSLPPPLRTSFALIIMVPLEARGLAGAIAKGRLREYLREWTTAGELERGMSRWHDRLDWIGGYPFEVAKPEEVFAFCLARGFELRRMATMAGDHGCNQFVFERAR